jgi:hypothetical protein
MQIDLQQGFRRGYATNSWVNLERYGKAPGCCLKDRFGDVVTVAAVMQQDMKVHAGMHCYGLPELTHQLGVETANFLGGKLNFPNDEWAPT